VTTEHSVDMHPRMESAAISRVTAALPRARCTRLLARERSEGLVLRTQQERVSSLLQPYFVSLCTEQSSRVYLMRYIMFIPTSTKHSALSTTDR